MQLSTTESAWTFIFGLQSDASASLKSVCQHYTQYFHKPNNYTHLQNILDFGSLIKFLQTKPEIFFSVWNLSLLEMYSIV